MKQHYVRDWFDLIPYINLGPLNLNAQESLSLHGDCLEPTVWSKRDRQIFDREVNIDLQPMTDDQTVNTDPVPNC